MSAIYTSLGSWGFLDNKSIIKYGNWRKLPMVGLRRSATIHILEHPTILLHGLRHLVFLIKDLKQNVVSVRAYVMNGKQYSHCVRYAQTSLLSKIFIFLCFTNHHILWNTMELLNMNQFLHISRCNCALAYMLQVQTFYFLWNGGTEIELVECRHYVRGRQITSCIIKTSAKCHSYYRNIH